MASAISVQDQLDKHRKSVAFDSYDVAVRELIGMISTDMIDIAPEYQRHFKWSQERQSELIESLFLGIPVPSLYMATNSDSTWEVIDGLQRITTIVNFAGSAENIERISTRSKKLILKGLQKLDSLNGLCFEELPKSLQLMFLTRPLRVTVLNDRSDFTVRYDLFERLNTGGVTLHPQEIRNCIFIGEFNDFIKGCASQDDFKAVVKMPQNAEISGSLEELVLRFFAYLQDSDLFEHGVESFLNNYMEKKTKSFKDRASLAKIFTKTFSYLKENLPRGITRANRPNTTSVVLYEAISVGVAHIFLSKKNVDPQKLINLLDDKELVKLTTGATNSKKMLMSRIDYVKKNAVK
jgi:uncharacterized protein with ParB-like and HNH nuclease domain